MKLLPPKNSLSKDVGGISLSCTGTKYLMNFSKPVRLTIFRTIARNTHQNRFRMQAKHCKFKQQRRIEHHIRILLIREYPFIFAGTHTRPAGDSLAGRISPIIKVADNAAKQRLSVVGIQLWSSKEIVVNAET